MNAPAKSRTAVESVLLPLLNLAAALLISGLVIKLIGEQPWRAFRLLVTGAFGTGENLGYTLYYATNFIFTGLSVAVAYHAGLFNIGAEGQAYIGGLGSGLVCLAAGHWPFALVLPAAIVAGAFGGAAWAFIPGYLQARRGSHVVITTIMFNFLASALMTYLLVHVLIEPGQQTPQSRAFAPNTWMPSAKGALGSLAGDSPLNLAFVLALLAALGTWVYLWKTRWGFALRVAGENPAAARYAGISPERITIVAMLLSGGLAGCLGLNELMGSQHVVSLDFPAGAGFVGIAVALMGRNRPLGIVLAAVLFGALVQGGSELSFDMPHVTRDLVVVIQGLVILFCGALENLFKRPLALLWRRTP
ncbi:MAG TPA: ABC transporter permease [Opitutaceae bacterium]|jgi:simple sugar transport system permease protein